MAVYVFDRSGFMGTHTIDGDVMYIDDGTGLAVVENDEGVTGIVYLGEGQLMILDKDEDDEDQGESNGDLEDDE